MPASNQVARNTPISLMQTYLPFREEVGEVLHRIAANAGDVLVAPWFRDPQ